MFGMGSLFSPCYRSGAAAIIAIAILILLALALIF